MQPFIGWVVQVPELIPSWRPQEVTTAHELQVRLHTFSMFGMPRLPREDRQHWEIGEGNDNSVAIEKSWKELVPGHKVSLTTWGPRHTHTPPSPLTQRRERPWEVGSTGTALRGMSLKLQIWARPRISETPQGTSETSQGTSEALPGTSEAPPGTSEAPPGTSETPPGTSETPPRY